MLFYDTSTNLCLTCSAIIPNCDLCSYNGTYTPIYPPNVTCIQAKPGYYLDNSTNIIYSCMDNCLNCTSGTTCDACETNFIFNGTCLCDSFFYYNSINTNC